MKWLAVLLITLIAIMQFRLWFATGSVLEVQQLEQRVTKEQVKLASLKARNSQMIAEINDLRNGFDAIEERARAQLGMIKGDEVFYRIIED